jgi:hypothetical protein
LLAYRRPGKAHRATNLPNSFLLLVDPLCHGFLLVVVALVSKRMTACRAADPICLGEGPESTQLGRSSPSSSRSAPGQFATATRRAAAAAFLTPRELGATANPHPAVPLLIDVAAVIAVLRPLGQIL